PAPVEQPPWLCLIIANGVRADSNNADQQQQGCHGHASRRGPRLATRRSGVLAIVSRSTLLGYLRARPRTKRRPGLSRLGVEGSHVIGANSRPAPERGAVVTRPQPPFRQYSFPSSAATRISGRPSPSRSARIGSPTRRPSATDQSRRGLPSRSPRACNLPSSQPNNTSVCPSASRSAAISRLTRRPTSRKPLRWGRLFSFAPALVYGLEFFPQVPQITAPSSGPG